MAESWWQSRFRRFPPVTRRDETIARLKRKVADLRADQAALDTDLKMRTAWARDVRQPSYQARLHIERRLRRLETELGMPSKSVIRHGKFHVYDLARSHGISPPVEYGRWEHPTAIPWADLPDLLVIKAAYGRSQRGVLPLRRAGLEWQIVTTDESWSAEQLTARLTTLVEDGDIGGPFVAEQFLDEDGTGTRLPTDVKVYAFYGEVPMVVLRRPGRRGEHVSLTPFRAVDAHGRDIVGLETPSLIDPALPVPALLAETVEAASRLSVAIRAPFSRLDFYCIHDVIFGEVTPRPGGDGWHGPVVDQMLGEAWERAQVRLACDIAAGMSAEPEFGTFADPPP